MAKSENKTQPTKINPRDFIKSLKEPEQKDVVELLRIFEEATGWRCVMWGNMFGFGVWHYKSVSREGDWPATAFAMRSTGVVVYTMVGHNDYPELLEKLGKFKNAGKSCLSFKKLEDIHVPTLKKLIKIGIRDLKKKYKVE